MAQSNYPSPLPPPDGYGLPPRTSFRFVSVNVDPLACCLAALAILIVLTIAGLLLAWFLIKNSWLLGVALLAVLALLLLRKARRRR